MTTLRNPYVIDKTLVALWDARLAAINPVGFMESADEALRSSYENLDNPIKILAGGRSWCRLVSALYRQRVYVLETRDKVQFHVRISNGKPFDNPAIPAVVWTELEALEEQKWPWLFMGLNVRRDLVDRDHPVIVTEQGREVPIVWDESKWGNVEEAEAAITAHLKATGDGA